MEQNFCVRIDSLHLARDALRQGYMRLNQNLDETEAIRRRLAGCVCMGGCVQRLGQLKTKLEDELYALGQMNQALERAAECYLAAEARIVQEGETVSQSTLQHSFGSNDFRSIRQKLTDFSIF